MTAIDIVFLRRHSMHLVGNEPGVYFLFRQDRLVYVGQSWNCFLGVAEQTRKENPKSFDRWAHIRESDEAERRALVKALIAEHSPEYNR